MTKTYENPDPKRRSGGLIVDFEGKRPNIIIESFSDTPSLKIVTARTTDGIYTLWSENTYDSIGDWTGVQAVARVKELALSAKKK